MTTDLREELDALARTQTFSPDPSAWDRGRRARRRARVLRGAALVAVVAAIAGTTAVAVRPQAVGPAGDTGPDGAIPSRIVAPDGPVMTDLAIGRASVAYVDGFGLPVLVDATTGEARRVDLPDFPELLVADLEEWFRSPWLALAPDGRRLAYPAGASVERVRGVTTISTGWFRVVDLTTGGTSLVDLPPGTGSPRAISWTADGRLSVDVSGEPTNAEEPPPLEAWNLDPATGDSSTAPLTGVPAPSQGISAPYPADDGRVRAVPFETSTGTDPDRTLPTDLYPDGATVTPVGWADNSLLVAEVDAPAGSYVEGEHLVLMTSPDRPESEWTYRIVLRDLPPAVSLSFAVDLIPDLTGDPDQELTHDFTAEQSMGDSSGAARVLVSAGFFVLLGAVAVVGLIRRRA